MTWLVRSPVTRRVSWHQPDDLFSSLQRDVSRALEEVWGRSSSALPAQAASVALRLDVKEDEKAFHISADLPGLKESDVEVTFQEGVLTIRGEKKIERDESKDTWHFSERSYGSFARQLSLPTTIDAGKIDAKFDKGVLTITLPKLPDEKAQATKITVKAG